MEAARVKRAAEKQAAELRRKSSRWSRKFDPHGGIRNKAEDLTGGLGGTAGSESEEIREGDRVTIQSLNREGTVETIQDGSYIVMVGPLRYKADREDLQRSSLSPGTAFENQQSPVIDDLSEEPVTELKVIGLTADEALDRVDKFLDQAFLAGAENIRIIHGHGKGILRRAIAKFLTGHLQVDRFRLAPPEQGGGGVTLIELKK
jgi:DNA mismatch repair protein MutS2